MIRTRMKNMQSLERMIIRKQRWARDPTREPFPTFTMFRGTSDRDLPRRECCCTQRSFDPAAPQRPTNLANSDQGAHRAGLSRKHEDTGRNQSPMRCGNNLRSISCER